MELPLDREAPGAIFLQIAVSICDKGFRLKCVTVRHAGQPWIGDVTRHLKQKLQSFCSSFVSLNIQNNSFKFILQLSAFLLLSVYLHRILHGTGYGIRDLRDGNQALQ